MDTHNVSKLLFNVAEVRRILEHAQNSDTHCPTFGQCMDGRYRIDGRDWDRSNGLGSLSVKQVDKGKVPAGLHLAGDQGVYLMSNGEPPQQDPAHEDTHAVVSYALGINPEVDADWYEAKRSMFGGDDGLEFIPAEGVAAAMSGARDEDYLEITLSPDEIKITGVVLASRVDTLKARQDERMTALKPVEVGYKKDGEPGERVWTPAPWQVVDGTFIYALNEQGTNRFSAQVQPGYETELGNRKERVSEVELRANAAIMRAAPDLVEVLEPMVHMWSKLAETVKPLAHEPTYLRAKAVLGEIQALIDADGSEQAGEP